VVQPATGDIVQKGEGSAGTKTTFGVQRSIRIRSVSKGTHASAYREVRDLRLVEMRD
jgi:hypothetical protein